MELNVSGDVVVGSMCKVLPKIAGGIAPVSSKAHMEDQMLISHQIEQR